MDIQIPINDVTKQHKKSKESTKSLFFVLNQFTLSDTVMLLNKKEKEKRVIELANQGKTTREIASEVSISLGSIGKILNSDR